MQDEIWEKSKHKEKWLSIIPKYGLKCVRNELSSITRFSKIGSWI